jgi:hypothetical protein
VDAESNDLIVAKMMSYRPKTVVKSSQAMKITWEPRLRGSRFSEWFDLRLRLVSTEVGLF